MNSGCSPSICRSHWLLRTSARYGCHAAEQHHSNQPASVYSNPLHLEIYFTTQMFSKGNNLFWLKLGIYMAHLLMRTSAGSGCHAAEQHHSNWPAAAYGNPLHLQLACTSCLLALLSPACSNRGFFSFVLCKACQSSSRTPLSTSRHQFIDLKQPID